MDYSGEFVPTKWEILDQVSQETIMERYLGIPVVFGKSVLSPLRHDKHPTCRFYYTKTGKLIFKDFSGHFSGDCFSVVQFVYGIGFREALQKIAQDFNILLGTSNYVKKIPSYDITNSPGTKNPTRIQIQIRLWGRADLEYWANFGITERILSKYHVYPINYAWVNGRIVYHYHKDDPCYAYRFGTEKYKLYFPLRKKDSKKARFLSNTNIVQGLDQLPYSGNLLIITKSLKDVMVLDSFQIPAIALHSEVYLPDETFISELKVRFKHIFTLYDFDLTGVRTANRIKRTYGIRPIFLTNGKMGSPDFKAKDPAEFVARAGVDRAQKLIDNALLKYKIYEKRIVKNRNPELHHPRIVEQAQAG